MFTNLHRLRYKQIHRSVYLNLAKAAGVIYPVSIVTGLIFGFVVYGSFCIWQSGKRQI